MAEKRMKNLMFIKKMLATIATSTALVAAIVMLPAVKVNAASMQDAIEVKEGVLIKDSINEKDEVDWYKLTATEKTAYYTFTLNNLNQNDYGGGTSEFAVYNESGNLIGKMSARCEDSNMMNLQLQKGATYYLKLYNTAGITGDYTFQYKITEDIADVMTEASEIKSDVLYRDNMCTKDDVDWYKLSTSTDTVYYTFTFNNLTQKDYGGATAYFAVYSKDGVLVKESSAHYEGATTLNVKLDKEDTYFIKVYNRDGYTGEYSFTFTITSDIADVKEEAVLLENAKKYEDTICTEDDVDWYKFDLDCISDVKITFNNLSQKDYGGGTARVDVYFENGNFLEQLYVGYEQSKDSTVRLWNNQTYYLKVYNSAKHTGGYKIMIEKTPATGWISKDKAEYWCENGIKLGTEGRGKEIYDPDSDAWYWLDEVQDGAKTVSKDVYQESDAGIWGDLIQEDGSRKGKWVRYDANGHMIKGWSWANGNSYYFDEKFGTMAKGFASIDKQEYYFNAETGVREKIIGTIPENGWKTIDGADYWYENYQRQGYSVNSSYRGKEIYDPGSDAWYWLDNVDGGKKAVSKDVYQESLAGPWGDKTNEAGEKIGKWVRYDENGHMIKGWQTTDAGTYYFDPIYGTMAKGTVEIDGQTYNFDENIGILLTQ